MEFGLAAPADQTCVTEILRRRAVQGRLNMTLPDFLLTLFSSSYCTLRQMLKILVESR